jgi:hypothetical protein
MSCTTLKANSRVLFETFKIWLISFTINDLKSPKNKCNYLDKFSAHFCHNILDNSTESKRMAFICQE